MPTNKSKIIRDLSEIHQLLDSVLDEDIEITPKKLKALTPKYQAMNDELQKDERIKQPKYRVGRANHCAILYVETGREYLVFSRGKAEHIDEFCKWLNDNGK